MVVVYYDHNKKVSGILERKGIMTIGDFKDYQKIADNIYNNWKRYYVQNKAKEKPLYILESKLNKDRRSVIIMTNTGSVK